MRKDGIIVKKPNIIEISEDHYNRLWDEVESLRKRLGEVEKLQASTQEECMRKNKIIYDRTNDVSFYQNQLAKLLAKTGEINID